MKIFKRKPKRVLKHVRPPPEFKMSPLAEGVVLFVGGLVNTLPVGKQ